LHKAASVTATLINTVEAAMAAYKWAAAFSGPIGGAIAAASALAFGFAQVKRIQSYGEGGFTGKADTGFSDRHGKIAGYVHEDEFVFNKEKTKALRPFLEDIHNDRLNVKDLALLTRRGMIHQLVKNEFKSEILEREVGRIYRKIGEKQPIFWK